MKKKGTVPFFDTIVTSTEEIAEKWLRPLFLTIEVAAEKWLRPLFPFQIW
jgi:hypothetical protein